MRVLSWLISRSEKALCVCVCFVHSGKNPSLNLTRQMRLMEEGGPDRPDSRLESGHGRARETTARGLRRLLGTWLFWLLPPVKRQPRSTTTSALCLAAGNFSPCVHLLCGAVGVCGCAYPCACACGAYARWVLSWSQSRRVCCTGGCHLTCILVLFLVIRSLVLCTWRGRR